MKNIIISSTICLGILYGIDAKWFHGKYFDECQRIASEIYRYSR